MKYCERCKIEMDEATLFCPQCGFAVKSTDNASNQSNSNSSLSASNGLRTSAKVFMIIGTVLTPVTIFFSLTLQFPEMKMLFVNILISAVPLLWCIPMTVHYFHNGEYVGVKFKVLSLLFVNTLAGILMLCDKNYPNK